MLCMIDYGMGNLHSAKKALERMGAKVVISERAEDIVSASHIVLPGVGAFPDAMTRLNELGLCEVIRQVVKQGKPFLGICLGMQIMFESSTEGAKGDGRIQGLGIVSGCVERMNANGVKVPHMGWNEVYARADCPILDGVDGRSFYFVHSYCAHDMRAAGGVTEYGESFVSVAYDGKRAFGTQFHPEKSGSAGMRVLENFLRLEGYDA